MSKKITNGLRILVTSSFNIYCVEEKRILKKHSLEPKKTDVRGPPHQQSGLNIIGVVFQKTVLRGFKEECLYKIWRKSVNNYDF